MKSRVLIRVNGRRWKQVKTFAKSGPTDRHYVLEVSGDKTTIVFGNGVQGAQPSLGSNVEATYRTGSGSAGNVSAGNIVVTYRVATKPTPDQTLWVSIRNRTNVISFQRLRRFPVHRS
jgi:hypothetical protein